MKIILTRPKYRCRVVASQINTAFIGIRSLFSVFGYTNCSGDSALHIRLRDNSGPRDQSNLEEEVDFDNLDIRN